MKTFVALDKDWIVKAYSDAMAEWYTSDEGWDDDSYDVESDSE